MREQTGAAPAAIAVGIETPRGALVDTLIEQGFAVFAVNPKQLDRFRDRFTAAGAKDDRPRCAGRRRCACAPIAAPFDAVRPDDPLIIQLREADAAAWRTCRRTNSGSPIACASSSIAWMRAWLTLSPAADEPWLWTMLGRGAGPGHLGRSCRGGASPPCCARIAFVG